MKKTYKLGTHPENDEEHEQWQNIIDNSNGKLIRLLNVGIIGSCEYEKIHDLLSDTPRYSDEEKEAILYIENRHREYLKERHGKKSAKRCTNN